MNEAQKILRHDTIIAIRESVKEWFNEENGFFCDGEQQNYKAKTASFLAVNTNVTIVEINEIIISFLFSKGFSNEFINEQLLKVNKVFSDSLYLLTKFKIGEILYTFENNCKVEVINILPIKNKQVPIYVVFDKVKDFEYLISEVNLFKNSIFFEGAKFRLNEIVYSFLNRKNERHKRYQIIDINKEKDIIDGFVYKCIDKKGEVKMFNQSNLSLYSFDLIVRKSNVEFI